MQLLLKLYPKKFHLQQILDLSLYHSQTQKNINLETKENEKAMSQDKSPPEPTEIIFYQTEDGQSRLEVGFSGETC